MNIAESMLDEFLDGSSETGKSTPSTKVTEAMAPVETPVSTPSGVPAGTPPVDPAKTEALKEEVISSGDKPKKKEKQISKGEWEKLHGKKTASGKPPAGSSKPSTGGGEPDIVDEVRDFTEETVKEAADPKRNGPPTEGLHRYMQALNEVLDYGMQRGGKTALMAGSIAGLNALGDQSVGSNVLDTAISTIAGLAAAKAATKNKAVIGGLMALGTSTVLDPFLDMLASKEPKQFNPYTGSYY